MYQDVYVFSSPQMRTSLQISVSLLLKRKLYGPLRQLGLGEEPKLELNDFFFAVISLVIRSGVHLCMCVKVFFIVCVYVKKAPPI